MAVKKRRTVKKISPRTRKVAAVWLAQAQDDSGFIVRAIGNTKAEAKKAVRERWELTDVSGWGWTEWWSSYGQAEKLHMGKAKYDFE